MPYNLVSTVILFWIFVNVVVDSVRATLKLTGIIWKGTKLKTKRIFNFHISRGQWRQKKS